MLCLTCSKEKSGWEMCFDSKKSCPTQPCRECKKVFNEGSERVKLNGKGTLGTGRKAPFTFRGTTKPFL